MKRARISSLSIDDNISPAGSRSTDSDHVSKYAMEERNEVHRALQCTLPPHLPENFNSIAEFERHYLTAHAHRCSECHNNFPSAHYLDLHISEYHDPISAVRQEAGSKIFACFVEGCDKVCADWKKRRSHLIDKHGFPRNYDFLVIRDGTDGRRSLLRAGVDVQGHRRSSRDGRREDEAEDQSTVQHHEDQAEEIKKRETHENIDDVISCVSSLRLVPRNISFGRRKGQTGLSDH